MTYVEFFDKNSIENVCACLTMLPKEVILVGSDKTVMERHCEICEKLFQDRGQEVKFSCRSVSKWSTAKVVETIEDILKTYEDCEFGITGGDEMVIFALGIVCERNREKNIQVHKINIQNNTICDCDMDGTKIAEGSPVLSVEENVRIYGGSTSSYEWILDSDFEADVKTIWEICKKNPTSWNAQIGVFNTIQKRGTITTDELTMSARIDDLEQYYRKHDGTYHINPAIKNLLMEKKLVTKLEEVDGVITVSFKNAQVKKCLTTAGQALEMKIYLTAKKLKDKKDNSNIYNDVRTGVTIDWDGKDASATNEVDVINEIDVLMMHNMIPVFVSCKNGAVTADELYKLNTVSERFGGKYAKKVLVSSVLQNLYNGEDLKQRAKDMNIKIITDDDLMDDKQLENKLKNMWS